METAKLIEIVRKAIGGDDEALQELYMDSSKRVFFAANKILRDENDAEDIMHDVFITIFEKLADLREPAAYYKWANQVTANRCASFQRRKKAEPLEEQDLIDALEMEDVNDTLTPEKLFDDEETRRLIMDVIDTLPDNQRMCIIYRYFNQLSIEEIADITDTNEFTVKNRLAIARKKLRVAILEKEEKEDIRLHVLIPIMPVLMKALDDFQMPEGVMERVWARVAESAGIAAGTAAASQAAGTGGGASGQIGPKPGGPDTGADSGALSSNNPASGGADGSAGADASGQFGPKSEGLDTGADSGGTSGQSGPKSEGPNGSAEASADVPTDAPGSGEALEHSQPKGDADMSNQYGSNNGPGQPGRNPQGNNAYQQGQQPYQQQQGWQPPQNAPGTPPPASAMGAAKMGAAVAKAGMSLGAKIAIGVAAVALVAAGVLFLPGLLSNPSDVAAPPAQGIVDNAGVGGSQASSGDNTGVSDSQTTDGDNADASQATSSSDNSQQPATANNSSLTLQILDSHNGIFCFNDPNLKASYPLGNENFENFEEMHQWAVYVYGGDNDHIEMGVSLSNWLSYTGELTAHHLTDEENWFAHHFAEGIRETNTAFPIQVQTAGQSIYISFTIPEDYAFDLDTASGAAYFIFNTPDNTRFASGRLPLANVIVDDIEAD